MGDKSVETLGSKIRFLSMHRGQIFLASPPNNVDFFFFISLTVQSTATRQH